MGQTTKKITATPEIKNLSDQHLRRGDKVRLYVVRKQSGGLCFQYGMVELNRIGESLPSYRYVNVPKELRVKEGEVYDAVVTTIVRTGSIYTLDKKREAIFVDVKDYVRHEEHTAIRLVGSTLVRETLSGKVVVVRETIPVQIESKLYRYEDRLISTIEVSVAGRFVFRRLANHNPHHGTMFEKLAGKLPEMSAGQHRNLGQLCKSWAAIKEIHDAAQQVPKREQPSLAMAS